MGEGGLLPLVYVFSALEMDGWMQRCMDGWTDGKRMREKNER